MLALDLRWFMGSMREIILGILTPGPNLGLAPLQGDVTR
jgi:hypothetical protein